MSALVNSARKVLNHGGGTFLFRRTLRDEKTADKIGDQQARKNGAVFIFFRRVFKNAVDLRLNRVQIRQRHRFYDAVRAGKKLVGRDIEVSAGRFQQFGHDNDVAMQARRILDSLEMMFVKKRRDDHHIAGG